MWNFWFLTVVNVPTSFLCDQCLFPMSKINKEQEQRANSQQSVLLHVENKGNPRVQDLFSIQGQMNSQHNDQTHISLHRALHCHLTGAVNNLQKPQFSNKQKQICSGKFLKINKTLVWSKPAHRNTEESRGTRDRSDGASTQHSKLANCQARDTVLCTKRRQTLEFEAVHQLLSFLIFNWHILARKRVWMWRDHVNIANSNGSTTLRGVTIV